MRQHGSVVGAWKEMDLNADGRLTYFEPLIIKDLTINHIKTHMPQGPIGCEVHAWLWAHGRDPSEEAMERPSRSRLRDLESRRPMGWRAAGILGSLPVGELRQCGASLEETSEATRSYIDLYSL